MRKFENEIDYLQTSLRALAYQMELIACSYLPSDTWYFDDEDLKDLRLAAQLLGELAEKAWMYDELCK